MEKISFRGHVVLRRRIIYWLERCRMDACELYIATHERLSVMDMEEDFIKEYLKYVEEIGL